MSKNIAIILWEVGIQQQLIQKWCFESSMVADMLTHSALHVTIEDIVFSELGDRSDSLLEWLKPLWRDECIKDAVNYLGDTTHFSVADNLKSLLLNTGEFICRRLPFANEKNIVVSPIPRPKHCGHSNQYAVKYVRLGKYDQNDLVEKAMTAISNDFSGNNYYFHGTRGESAVDIITNGIDIEKGELERDFGRSFYLNPDCRDAIKFAIEHRRPHPSIIVFNSSSTRGTKKHCLFEEPAKWNKFVVSSRNLSLPDSEETRKEYFQYDIIEGPQATPKNNNEDWTQITERGYHRQLALKTPDEAKKWDIEFVAVYVFIMGDNTDLPTYCLDE